MRPPPLHSPSRRRDGGATHARLAALLVAGIAFAVHLTNLRPMGTGDTVPARLLPFSLLREGDLDLDEFGWLRAPELQRPYFLRADGSGRWRSKYPVATPLVATPLAAPFVWWARARGIDDLDARFRLLSAVFERVAAALIGAVSVGVVLLAAREIAPLGWATAAALCYAFGTGTWVYGQALWQHGLAELAIAAAALALLRPATRAWAVSVGLAAALAVAARPTALVVAAILGLAVWRHRRRHVWSFAGAFAVGVLPLLAYNLAFAARVTGGYSAGAMVPPDLERLFGLLVSPSRGLLVYCPLAVLAVVPLWRRVQPAVLREFALALPAYVLFFTCSRIWWGGFSYGPRFFADVMPLVVLSALPVARQLWARRGGRALLVAGAAWCVTVQAIGVYCDDHDWNNFPVAIDQQPARLWDWSDPQILRALRSGWHGGDFATLLGQLVSDPRPAPLVPLAPADLAGAVEAVAPGPWRCRAGRPCRIDLRLANRGGAVWPAYTDHGNLTVGLAVLWRAGGALVPDVGGFVPLRRQFGPGDVAEVRVAIDTPSRPGAYELELTLVQTLGTAGQSGGASLSVPVAVE